MNTFSTQVTAATISAAFQDNLAALETFTNAQDSAELTRLYRDLQNEIQTYLADGILSIALIGQYSAGKSTIISALTNRRDLKIDADIATDETAIYEWQGLHLIDTPGLYTDRKDHDEKTYEAIARADLLVFCLTPMLLDSITSENFQKLAYKLGYRWKMMLVVNKMSDEAGEDDQKIHSYTDSLQKAIEPYSIQEFPLCFVDAKDYCEGVDQADPEYIEWSRFNTFVNQLNQFSEERGTLARLDTPSRICLKYLENFEIHVVRSSGKDTAFLEVLSRLNRRLEKERERLRTKVKALTLQLMTAIINEGMKLAGEVGDTNFDLSCQQSELVVKVHYDQAAADFEVLVKQAIETLKQEILMELQSDLTQTFVARFQHDADVQVGNVSTPNLIQMQEQVGWLQGLAELLGGGLTKAATNNLLSLAAGSGFLSSSQVAGSVLHQTVLTLGHWIGFKFQPWQAVGIAKNIGNAAMFIGPALALVAVGLDFYSMQQEREYELKMAKVRDDINSQFQASAQELKTQIEQHLFEVEHEVYGKLEQDISQTRISLEQEMAQSETNLSQLLEIRIKFKAILDSLQQHGHGSTVAKSFQ
jgi:GTP-binding protein EngB required for normal cell division